MPSALAWVTLGRIPRIQQVFSHMYQSGGNHDLICTNRTPVSVCTLQSFKKYSVPCEKRKNKRIAWKLLCDDWKKNKLLFDQNSLYDWKEFVQVKNLWNPEKKEYFNIYKGIKCPKPTFLEFAGVLSDRTIAENSTCLAKCPNFNQFVLTKAELENLNLCDISILKNHRFLQFIDLSYNNLENIEALGSISYLMYLDVSHNRLTKLLDFKAPWKLTYVNYSHNKLTEISNISEFWSLTHINLAHNSIAEIKNLENLKFLEVLDLSYNKIEILINLHTNPLRNLNLNNNLIWTYKTNTTEKMNDLMKLNLSHNHINQLNLLEIFCAIKDLDLSFNFIDNILDLEHFKTMNRMEILNLIGNPIVQWAQYRFFFIFQLKSLKELDGIEVSSLEKVKAKQCYEIKGQRYENFLLFGRKTILSKRKTALEGGLFPIDQPTHPLIAIIGPIYGLIADFLQYISSHRKYKHLFYVLKCHATESNIYDLFNFIIISTDQFTNYLRENKFKAIGYRYGFKIGLSNEEMNKWVYSRKIGIFNAPINLIQNLRLVGIELLVICAFPEDLTFQELISQSRISICTFSFQEGAFFYKKRPINIKEVNFSPKDIVNELIIRVIPSNDQAMTVDYSRVIKDVKRALSQEFLEDFGNLTGDYKSLYNSSLNSYLKEKIPNNFKNLYSKYGDANIYSPKMMKEKILETSRDSSNISEYDKKKISSEQFSFISSDSKDISWHSFSSKKKQHFKEKTTIFSTYNGDEEVEIEIDTLKSSSSSDTVIDERLRKTFHTEILPGDQITLRKKMISTVTKVLQAHRRSIADIYYQANIRQPGLFSRFIYINLENYLEVILKGIKETVKETNFSISNFESIKETKEYKEVLNTGLSFVSEVLEKNSTTSKKQGFINTGFKTSRCKFF